MIDKEERTYSIGITSPSPDILLDPFKGFNLVFETEVGSTILCDLISVSIISSVLARANHSLPETEDTKSVVQCNYYYGFLLYISFGRHGLADVQLEQRSIR